MEIVAEQPVLTPMGVLQTVRKYNYETNQVIIERQFNGKPVSTETFYID